MQDLVDATYEDDENPYTYNILTQFNDIAISCRVFTSAWIDTHSNCMFISGLVFHRLLPLVVHCIVYVMVLLQKYHC